MPLNVTIKDDHNASCAAQGCAMQMRDSVSHAEMGIRQDVPTYRTRRVRGRPACSTPRPDFNHLPGARRHIV